MTPKLPKGQQTLEQRVDKFLQEHNLLIPGDKVVVAVSGGPDSVCLLHILLQLKEKLAIELYAAHLNHKLRGAESDADAAYVTELARRFSVPLIIEAQDAAAHRKKKGGSLEEAARELRYAFLARSCEKVGASKVAVGHTRDDNVETILLHLLRGTGISGLRGLRPASTLRLDNQTKPLNIVRPLLEVSRYETLAYCKEHDLCPRTDSSNLSPRFLRNRIRLELLPTLRKYNPAIEDSLLRLSTIACDDIAFLEGQANTVWKELAKEEETAIYLDASKLSALPPALQRQVFRKAVEKLKGNLRDIEIDHVDAMIAFLNKPAGKRLILPRSIKLISGYGYLVLTLLAEPPCPLPPLFGSFRLNIPGNTIIPGWQITATITNSPVETRDDFTANFDFDRCGDELIVRSRKPGDRFQPLGMVETKKLQDFMVDSKIPRTWRDKIPIVCSPAGILWVVGWRISEAAKVTIDTKQVLHLKFNRL